MLCSSTRSACLCLVDGCPLLFCVAFILSNSSARCFARYTTVRHTCAKLRFTSSLRPQAPKGSRKNGEKSTWSRKQTRKLAYAIFPHPRPLTSNKIYLFQICVRVWGKLGKLGCTGCEGFSFVWVLGARSKRGRHVQRGTRAARSIFIFLPEDPNLEPGSLDTAACTFGGDISEASRLQDQMSRRRLTRGL